MDEEKEGDGFESWLFVAQEEAVQTAELPDSSLMLRVGGKHPDKTGMTRKQRSPRTTGSRRSEEQRSQARLMSDDSQHSAAPHPSVVAPSFLLSLFSFFFLSFGPA